MITRNIYKTTIEKVNSARPGTELGAHGQRGNAIQSEL